MPAHFPEFGLLALLTWMHVDAVNPPPQPCPENPIVLTGSDYPQFVYSPYDEVRQYPPNTDCRFVLVARSLQHRIYVNVIESRLEEPLFTDCKDYVSVRDGGLTTSQEIIRWCGSYFPPALTSSGDSLFVHFHSDNIVQSRGFNLSFVDYDWIPDQSGTYCYKLFDSVQGYTFHDAQRACYYDRSNLLTIENVVEYKFIVNQYADSHRFPWIGYNDANKEGVFDPIDPNVPMWPEDFGSRADHKDKDCVFLDWNNKDGTAHTIDDCRNRHAFICKKRQDGTTVPIQLSATLLRHGFEDPAFNYTVLLLILILLIILLIIVWIVYQKCKNRNVIAASEGSRLVQQSQSTSETTHASKFATTTNQADGKSKENSHKKKQETKSKTASTDAVKRALETSATRTTGAAQEALKKTDSDGTFQLVPPALSRITASALNERPSGESDTPRIRATPNQTDADGGAGPEDVELLRAQRRDSNPVLSEESDADENGPKTPRRDRRHIYESGAEPVEQPVGEPVNADQVAEPVIGQQVYEPVIKDPVGEPVVGERVAPPGKGTSLVPAEKVAGPVMVGPGPAAKPPTPPTALSMSLAPVGEPALGQEAAVAKETTSATVPSTHRSRSTQPGHGFERPKVGTLENVSAISLDEFWQEK